MSQAIPMRWTGDSFTPLNGWWQKESDRLFVVGEVYRMAAEDEHSDAARGAFFATVRELWKNLPENLSATYSSPDALRKRALIKTGWADRKAVVFDTDEAAIKAAALVKTMDDFAVVTQVMGIVTVYTAKSQSKKTMKKEEFNRSSEDVLRVLSKLIGVSTDQALSARAA